MLWAVERAKPAQQEKKTSTGNRLMSQSELTSASRISVIVALAFACRSTGATEPPSLQNSERSITASTWRVAIPLPTGMNGLGKSKEVAGTRGSGASADLLTCPHRTIFSHDWVAVLERRGYLVQTGSWDISSAVYGLRFRNEHHYGDIAIWAEGALGCQHIRIRVYVGTGAPRFSDRYEFFPSPLCGLVSDPDVTCLPFFVHESGWEDAEFLYRDPIEPR